MAVAQIINSLEQLKPFLNKDSILEIVMRDKTKKFKAFQKVLINNFPDGDSKELLQKAIRVMNKNNDLTQKSLSMMKAVTKFQKLNLVFGALNLCATCAGFAIMNAKLEKISGQIDQIVGTVKEGHDINANYKFHRILSEHANMLDSRKTQKYYTEEQMRALVDDEYNLLNMLVDTYNKNHTVDVENLVVSIFSMASMLAVSLRYFDELYYLNNKDTIGDGDIWHSQHDNWTSVFRKLMSEEFVAKLQDYLVFDKGLSMFEADAYYLNLLDQVKEMEEAVADNQKLIVELGDMELMTAFEAYVNQEVSADIKDAFDQTEGAMENAEVVDAYQNAMRQMALAA